MSSSSHKQPLAAIDTDTELYATCGAGLGHLLASELTALGIPRVQIAGSGVRFAGGLAAGYTACLWSRVANRVVLPIHEGPAATPEALYELAQEVDWSAHVDVDGTLAVDFLTAKSAITHTQYGALKVKDAIVDQFRLAQGRRPNVDRDSPDLRVNVYLFRDKARFAIDLSGSSLHRRGYREEQGLAPLKENLGAALLYQAQWPDAVERGLPLIDPLCGSGTLLIEAAMMACHMAPGLLRDYFGFQGWKGHDAALWQSLRDEAEAARRPSPVLITGSDQSVEAVYQCRQNILAAGLEQEISVAHQALSEGRCDTLPDTSTGLLITNPPYGERLAADQSFYSDLGQELSRYFAGWHCALFTAEAAPFHRIRLPLHTSLKVRNGGIDCVLLVGDIPKARVRASTSASTSASTATDNQGQHDSPELAADGDADEAAHPQAALYRGPVDKAPQADSAPAMDTAAFVNRVKKNQRALKGWLRQNDIRMYRIYDADLPEFAVAIDVYESGERHCVVQEYQAPATVNQAMAQARLEALMKVIPETLSVRADCVHLKVREVKAGLQQYEKHNTAHARGADVSEFGSTLEVNFTDYLDTGIFLDHRPVRRYLLQNSRGRRFLNLFAYTATATVAAVRGGAASSVSVDSSNRYCQWAKRNLDRNDAALQRHEVVRQDVLGWLADAALNVREDTLFDIILLDPPTFSNSSSRDSDWSVQRDHVSAIHSCLSLLAPGGTLIFSNNFRRFKIDPSLASNDIEVEDRCRWSIDRDFQRNPKIHHCWFIRKKAR